MTGKLSITGLKPLLIAGSFFNYQATLVEWHVQLSKSSRMCLYACTSSSTNIINKNHSKDFSCLPASALWRFITCLTLGKSSCTEKISTRWGPSFVRQDIAYMTRFKTCCGEGVLQGLLPKCNRFLHHLSISTKILHTINYWI